jgi:1-deoxy-D-xylulose-5-phosphate reductoisomerase
LKRLVILGSSGSIGRNTLDVVSKYPDKFRVVGLAVKRNINLLLEQIEKFRPEIVGVYDEAAAEQLRRVCSGVRVVSGMEGLKEIAGFDNTDLVVSAIVGSQGLIPTYEAIIAGKDIALATKEVLVMAGKIIMKEASKRGVKIIPVDSEHSALFQCLEGRRIEDVDRLILTASGGPFLRKTKTELEKVTPDEALQHPTWDMGKKITIDSATLMNKGLEVIEAYWLFGIPVEKIDIVLHPQSIVHSMVRFIDGSIIAQMSVPDMRGPISYALSYPERLRDVIRPLNLSEIGELTFEEPDPERFPSIPLTYKALKTGGTMPCVLNTANEVAVNAFLNRDISFPEIVKVVSYTMERHDTGSGDSLEEILQAYEWAKGEAVKIIKEFQKAKE